MKNYKFILTIVILLILGSLLMVNIIQENKSAKNIKDFDDCMERGFPILESYPEQCIANGEKYMRFVGNEMEKIDLIVVENPRPNQSIKSPLSVNGRARGYWFFEASFPVRLFDDNGNEISIAVASAVLDENETWMTEDFVNFETIIEFEKPETKKGLLIFEKDNPSGLPENEDSLMMPVYFE